MESGYRPIGIADYRWWRLPVWLGHKSRTTVAATRAVAISTTATTHGSTQTASQSRSAATTYPSDPTRHSHTPRNTVGGLDGSCCSCGNVERCFVVDFPRL
eukprot:scaffold28167_cov168-Amphora_coffeaeformis.AAC.1